MSAVAGPRNSATHRSKVRILAAGCATLAMTRTEALAPLLLLLLMMMMMMMMMQVSAEPKKIPDQPKARKSGKSRMHRPMDDLLLDPVLPGDRSTGPNSYLISCACSRMMQYW